jgi:hypothetical protein
MGLARERERVLSDYLFSCVSFLSSLWIGSSDFLSVFFIIISWNGRPHVELFWIGRRKTAADTLVQSFLGLS